MASPIFLPKVKFLVSAHFPGLPINYFVGLLMLHVLHTVLLGASTPGLPPYVFIIFHQGLLSLLQTTVWLGTQTGLLRLIHQEAWVDSLSQDWRSMGKTTRSLRETKALRNIWRRWIDVFGQRWLQ